MQRQLAGYHARWDIVTHLISLKVDGSAKSCLRDKRVIPLVCISKHRSIRSNGYMIINYHYSRKIHKKNFCEETLWN